jgi:hypothetical protein
MAADVSAGANERTEPPPWSSPWADDARRLFQLVQSAVEQAEAASGRESAEPEHPPECRYCPFCQGVGLLRRAGPDVLDQVSDFAAGLAATLRAAQPPAAGTPAGAGFDKASADEPGPEAGRSDSAGRSGERPESEQSPAAARPPSTVRIDVTD